MRNRLIALAVLGFLTVLLAGCPQTQPPDFVLEPSVTGVQVHQGGSATAVLRIEPRGNFSGTVTISLKMQDGSDLPAGITYSPSTVDVSGSTAEVSLQIDVAASVPVGEYRTNLTATSGSISHSVGFKITVVPPAGTLDESFGSGGVTVLNDLTQEQGENDFGYSLAFGDDGAIFVLGRSGDHLVVTKLDDKGQPVNDFASVGVLLLADLRSGEDGRNLDLDRAILPLFGGDFLTAGYAYDATNQDDLLLAMFDQDGNFVSSFGSGGIKTYDNLLYGGSGHANERAFSLAPDAGGVWIGGMAFQDDAVKEQALVMKVDLSNPDSPVRAGFGGPGGSSEYAYSVQALTNGAFFGGATNDGGQQGAWLRVDENLADQGHGSLPDFRGGRLTSVAKDDQGRFLLAGYASNGSDLDIVVERTKPDGTLDTDFGNGGKAQFDAVGGSPGSDLAYSLAVDGQGNILVAGRTFVSGHGNDLVVLRLEPDGSLDPSFGNGGVFTYDGGNGDDGAFEVALDGSGRPVVVGYSENAGGDYDMLALRLVP
ncbi:MAG TPA: hypothetical protein ENK37_01435 [Oceanithermus profundus]|uniref:Uncharacterized protein n=1 Tax=Oceanithermus profundus TaxID=187137 RepID=A0A7C4VAZ5_9DEIN|nr:hypothetical protein [Oceanithermus profundus]